MHPYQREPGTRDALDYVDRYDEEIAYVDAALGRLIEGLSRELDLERAILVFAADHGESMLEHERWFTHGYQVYEEIVRVPLLLRGPGIAPGRRAHPVSLVDLVPTLLRRVGADVPPDLDGRDLLAPGAPAQRSVFAEANGVDERWRAVVRGREKWVARVLPGEREPSGVRDYDLAADPGERAPAPWPSRPDEAPRALLELIRGDPLAGGAPARARTRIDPRADPDDLEALRALGYAE